MIKSSAELVAEAEREIETLGPDAAASLLGKEGVLFVDLRESGELRREGRIPGALNVPRGLLEFWIDPESPYYKPELGEAEALVLFCALSWRSALAARTLKDMGLGNVSHIKGGFSAWRAAGLPVEGGEPARR